MSRIFSALLLLGVISNTFCVTIVQRLLDRTTYNLKYKYGGAMTPMYVTIHNTANSAPAINEANYLNNRQDNVYISFHYAVDDIQALQLLPNNEAGWHAGDGSGDGNKKSIGIEICYSTHSDVSLRNKSTLNGAQLAAQLLKQYGWGC
jgi:N-acetylmuramoyl-L-alanine amidase